MGDKHCPHCGELMACPFGQFFYCKNDCDKKQATENEGASVSAHAKDGWFPLSGWRLVQSPLTRLTVDKGYDDAGKVLLLDAPNILGIYTHIPGFRFTRKRFSDGNTSGYFYIGTNRGLSQFYWHHDDPAKQIGYFGAKFKFKMTDGTVKLVKGPFSSRAGAINMCVEEDSLKMVDIVIEESQGRYQRRHVTLPFAHHMAAHLGLNVYAIKRGHEPYYVVQQ